MTKICVIIAAFLMCPLMAQAYSEIELADHNTNNKFFLQSNVLMEGSCPNPEIDSYRAAECHYNLGYAYYALWSSHQIDLDTNPDGGTFAGSIWSKYYLNRSAKHYEEAIRISQSPITPEELARNDKFGFLFNGLILVTLDYIQLHDYDAASNRLAVLEQILNTMPEANTTELGKKALRDYESLRTAATPSKVVMTLEGDIDPLELTQPKVKPRIILTSLSNETKLYLLTQKNSSYVEITPAPKEGYDFVIEKTITLDKRNALLFPFDSYEAKMKVGPSKVRPANITISLPEGSTFDGTAEFDAHAIVLRFRRSKAEIVKVLVSAFAAMLLLIILNARIKNFTKRSYAFRNLGDTTSALFSAGLLIISYCISGGNLLNIALSILAVVTVIRLAYKWDKLRV